MPGDLMSKSLMTMATAIGMRAGMKIGISGCLSALVLTSVTAAEKKLAEFDYFRLQASISAVANPEVDEDTSNGSSNTHYEWEGMRDTGYQAAITALFGSGISGRSSWQWGAEFVYGSYDITPQSFTTTGTGGGSNKNGSTAKLYNRTYGVNLVGGWQYGMMNLDEFTGFIEIMPHVGAAFATADNEVFDGTNYNKGSGNGIYYEAGIRLGAYITEKRFIYGVNINYQYGKSKVDVDFTGYSSEMELVRRGLGIGAVAGYRF
jgi:hypothetical protein